MKLAVGRISAFDPQPTEDHMTLEQTLHREGHAVTPMNVQLAGAISSLSRTGHLAGPVGGIKSERMESQDWFLAGSKPPWCWTWLENNDDCPRGWKWLLYAP